MGADPIEHYLGISYEKILTGDWEWKDEYSLAEQMIRIVNSYIDTEIEKYESPKGKSFKIKYDDIEREFYDLTDPPDLSEEAEYAERLQKIENAIKGDAQLELFMEAVREGMKRAEIAEMLEIQPRQLDKVREKLLKRVRNYKSS